MTFFSFFLESDRIFFQKKLVRQVIKLEWPKALCNVKLCVPCIPLQLSLDQRQLDNYGEMFKIKTKLWKYLKEKC